MKALFDDGNEDVDRDGDPDLRFHRIFRCAVEPLDTKMLFDPFEEEFDLPATFVEGADGRGWQDKVIGHEHECLARLVVFEADAAQVIGVISAAIAAV